MATVQIRKELVYRDWLGLNIIVTNMIPPGSVGITTPSKWDVSGLS